MSAVCICDFSDNNLTFLETNDLANSLIRFALDNNKAVFFFSPIRINGELKGQKIKGAKIKNGFELSDSFIDNNCEFIENFYEKILKANVSNQEDLRCLFFKTFKFLEEMLTIIFAYNVSTINLYISEENVDEETDFETEVTTTKEFLNCFYNKVVGEKRYISYFPTVKYIIKNIK